jgi:hypothetical protein
MLIPNLLHIYKLRLIHQINIIETVVATDFLLSSSCSEWTYLGGYSEH